MYRFIRNDTFYVLYLQPPEDPYQMPVLSPFLNDGRRYNTPAPCDAIRAGRLRSDSYILVIRLMTKYRHAKSCNGSSNNGAISEMAADSNLGGWMLRKFPCFGLARIAPMESDIQDMCRLLRGAT